MANDTVEEQERSFDENNTIIEDDETDGNEQDSEIDDSRPLKPITREELEAFKAKQERAGIIYISRIPPAMRPSKVRHLMSQYGAVGRIYLQREGKCNSSPG